MKRRISLFLVALLAVGGLAVAPVTTANAAGGTTKGTVKVQLQTPKAKDFKAKNFVIIANNSKKKVVGRDRTNSHGLAEFDLAPGKYTFTVATYLTKYEYARNTSTVIGISRGQVKTIGIKVYKGAVVTGKVMTPTGFALKGATVAAVTAKGEVLGMTTSDKKGKYRLAGLPTGKYAIEFNYRSYDDGKNKAALNYAWSFYKGTTAANAKKIKVYQQNKYAAATKTTGISGPVRKGSTVLVVLAQKNGSAGRLLVDHISATGSYIQSGSVYAPFKNGTSAKVRVVDGKYRLGVVYAGISYYYTGEYQTLTSDPAAATLYTYINGAPAGAHFGPIPQ